MSEEVNVSHRPEAQDIMRHEFALPASDFGLESSATMFPIGERDLASIVFGDESTSIGSVSQTHKAIVRLDTDEIVGIVSKKYQPLANSSYFSTVEQALRDAIPEEMREGVMVRDKVAGGGSWTQREYVFPAFAEELSNSTYSTKVGLRIVAWNSYDGSASAGLLSGLIDFICTNGMIVGRDIAKEMRRHSTLLTANHFLPRLRQNLGDIGGHIEEVRKMANTPLNQDAALSLLEKHFSGSRAAEILMRAQVEAERRGETVQALHAALTMYASHATDTFKQRSDDPAREARLLRGREDEVYRVVSTPEWRELLAA